MPTNLKTNRGLADILKTIKHHLNRLPHVGDKIPKTWFKVRQALEADGRDYISLADYLALCQANGLNRQADQMQLSGYLHDLGVCLHFQDDVLLKQTVILNPTWGTDAVYRVLDHWQVIQNWGQFSEADLTQIWAEERYASKQAELLQLMRKFKLCYPLPNQPGWYIAPHLLTKNQPEYHWADEHNLLLRYRYDFMPKGIITRFMVAMHAYIEKQAYVWYSGLILQKEETRAEVIEYYDRREIRVRIMGYSKRDFMAAISHQLAEIHQTYPRLKYSKLVPCHCPHCKTSQTPYFYSFERLRKRLAAGKNEVECDESYQMVDVHSLIDDIGGWGLGLDSRSVTDIQRFDLKQVRRLLTEGFSAEDLHDFCFDNPEFNPVYDALAEDSGKTKIIRLLIEHSKKRSLLGRLLELLKHHNQASYEAYQPYVII